MCGGYTSWDLSILIRKFIHSPSCGLFIKMGGSNSFPKKVANIVVGFIQRNILSILEHPKQSSMIREAILQTKCLQNSWADMESNM